MAHALAHNDFQQQISQFIDGELAPHEQPALFAHLSECTECRNFLNSALMLRSQLIASEPFGIPESLDRQPQYVPLQALNARPAAFRLALAASIAFLLLMGSLAFGPQMLRTQASETSAYAPVPGVEPLFYPQQN